MKNPSHYVYCLPEGEHRNCSVIRGSKLSGRFFIKTSDGEIYHIGRYPCEMTGRGINDADRKAYAKLKGVKLSELKKIMRSNDEAYKKKKLKASLEKLRRDAASKGYRLVKKVMP